MHTHTTPPTLAAHTTVRVDNDPFTVHSALCVQLAARSCWYRWPPPTRRAVSGNPYYSQQLGAEQGRRTLPRLGSSGSISSSAGLPRFRIKRNALCSRTAELGNGGRMAGWLVMGRGTRHHGPRHPLSHPMSAAGGEAIVSLSAATEIAPSRRPHGNSMRIWVPKLLFPASTRDTPEPFQVRY
jgi:hypothetical protein